MRAPIAAQQSGDLRLGRPGRYLGLELFQLRVGFGLQLLIAVLELLGRHLKLLIGTADLAVLRLHLVKLLFELLDQFAVEEVRQVIQVADVITLVLETTAMLLPETEMIFAMSR